MRWFVGLMLVGSMLVPVLRARGQDAPAPAPHALRLNLDLTSSVDGAPETSNTFQLYVFERLSSFGLRLDSLRPIGDARGDAWITDRSARWAELEPDAPPASISVVGSAGCVYENAAFFNQPQAHNFHGHVDVAIVDARGAEVARVGFEHSWGRLPQRRTQSQVQQEYNDMVFTGVVLALVHQPVVWAGIPADERAEVRTWIDAQKRRLLAPLERSMSDCELAVLLRGLVLPE